MIVASFNVPSTNEGNGTAFCSYLVHLKKDIPVTESQDFKVDATRLTKIDLDADPNKPLLDSQDKDAQNVLRDGKAISDTMLY